MELQSVAAHELRYKKVCYVIDSLTLLYSSLSIVFSGRE
jgi:hypothetical protein